MGWEVLSSTPSHSLRIKGFFLCRGCSGRGSRAPSRRLGMLGCCSFVKISENVNFKEETIIQFTVLQGPGHYQLIPCSCDEAEHHDGKDAAEESCRHHSSRRAVREGNNVNCGFFILFHQGLHPTGWCHPLSICHSTCQSIVPGNTLTDTPGTVLCGSPA